LSELLFPAIEELTGIDLSAFLPTIEAVFDALTTLFGDLNPLSGTFNPLDAVTTFIELMVSVGANLPMALIQELIGFNSDVPILSQLIGLFTGTTGGLTGLSGLGAIFGDLTGLLGDPTGLGSGTPALGSLNSIPVLGPLIESLINGGQPLNVLNLFGQLPQSLFGLIPASSIGGTSPNLLNNGPFDGSISMDGSGVWTWDAAVGHSSNGSARTTANGTLKALLSNAVDVDAGQVLTPTVWAKTSSYTGSGTPIRLAVRTYLAGAQVASTNIQSVAGAGLTSWTQLTGSYTVPAGVDQVRIRLVVDTTATAGSVWFDDATLTKPGNGPFDGILDLFGLGALDDLIGIDVTGIWSSLITGTLNPLSLLQDSGIRDFVKGLLDTLTGILRLIPFVGGTLADSLDNFADGLDSLNQSNIGNAATIAQIQAALGAGVPDADDFERATLGSNWRSIFSSGGTATVDGHNLVLAHTQATDYILLKTDKTAGSNFQTAEIVLGSAPGFNTILVDSARGHNDIWLRCTNFTTWATRTGVRLRWSGQNKNIKLSGWVNGSEVVTMFNAAVVSASSGSKMSLEAGSNGNTRRFIIRVNGSIITNGDIVESGTASQVSDTLNIWRGVGGATEHVGIDPFGASPDPGTVKVWTATG
jgi:hypothetical protein